MAVSLESLEVPEPQPVEYPVPFRWTRERYYAAVEAGIFGTETPVELIGGELVWNMSPQKSPHMACVTALQEVMTEVFKGGHTVRVQGPLSLGKNSDPEPDIAVVRGSWRDYVESHPTTAVLVAEVSESTLRYDRGIKAGLYASAGIPDYWVLDLSGRRLHVFRDPTPAPDQPFGWAYDSETTVPAEGQVSPLGAPEAVVRVADLLP